MFAFFSRPNTSEAAWPDASNTGVPTGVTVTSYTGSCTITSNTTIDAKAVKSLLRSYSSRLAAITPAKQEYTGRYESVYPQEP